MNKEDLLNYCHRRNLACDAKMTIPQLEKIIRADGEHIKKKDPIYDSLRTIPSSRYRSSPSSVHIQDEVNGKKFVPVALSGSWKQFIDAQTDSLKSQNKGVRSLKTKKPSPLLHSVDTIFIGDSYARLMEPPPPYLYVIAYPGIPLRSLDRSFTDSDRHATITQNNMDWIRPQILSPEKKSKKLYLSYGSTENPALPLKRMFYEFSSKTVTGRDMYSYPRVDIFRELVRFPRGQIKNIVFWMGNAELQITFYYKLLYSDILKDIPYFSPRFIKIFHDFVDAYVNECVVSYIEYLKMIHRLYPKLRIFVVLINYSPVKSRVYRSILMGMKGFSDVLSALHPKILQSIFDDPLRRDIVDQFNHTFLKNPFVQKHVHIIDINPVIFNYKNDDVYPRFILHPRDIHIADPKREVYRAILEKIPR